jgi:hypothetical protein
LPYYLVDIEDEEWEADYYDLKHLKHVEAWQTQNKLKGSKGN